MGTSSNKVWELLGLNQRQDVLESIFRVSDLESLKKYRLVCQLWNKEVLRVLPEKSYIVKTCKGSLVFLLSTLQSCPTPQYFFTALEVNFSDSNFNENLKQILKSYGHHLKTLRFSGDVKQQSRNMNVIMMNMNVVNQPPQQGPNNPIPNNINYNNNILYSPPDDFTHIRTNIKITSKLLVWCPNLLSIRFFTSIKIPDYNKITLTTNTKDINLLNSITTPLRLTSIELDGYMISSLRSYCLQLLLISPDLQSLQVSFGAKFVKGVPLCYEPVPDSVLFFLGLQKKPEITKRLKVLTVLGLKVPDLTDSISGLEFSSNKLHTIGISGSTNVSDPEFIKFVDFLHKIKKYQNLTTLTIFKCSCSTCEWRNWKEKSRWKDIEQTIPTMKNIKYLNVSSNGSYGIASLSMLNKFPSLHTLEFSLCKVGHANPDVHRDNRDNIVDFDYFFSDWAYLKMTTKYGGLLKDNCSKIKKLTIHHTLFKLESLKCIQECFPNLTQLNICIRSAVRYCCEVYMESKLSLSNTLERFSKLLKLEELNIVMPKGIIYPKQEVNRALKMLRDFPELRRFNLTLGPPQFSSRAPFRSGDASDPSIKESFLEDFIVINREEIHKFRSLNITFSGVCCCNVSKIELNDIRKVLSTYKHSYRFNWLCDNNARIFARYGRNLYEFSSSDISKVDGKDAEKNSSSSASSQVICESRRRFSGGDNYDEWE